MYTDPGRPTYGGGGLHVLRRPRTVGLGALPALAQRSASGPSYQQSAWYLARFGSGYPTTTTQTKSGGVIVAPDTSQPQVREPVSYIDPQKELATQLATQPATQPAPEPAPSTPSVQPTYSTADVAPLPSYELIASPGGGGAAPGDVSVVVEGSQLTGDQDEPRGFGMVEAGLAAALAFLIGKAWQDRR